VVRLLLVTHHKELAVLLLDPVGCLASRLLGQGISALGRIGHGYEEWVVMVLVMRRSVVPAHGGGQGLQEIGGRALDPIGNLNGGILRRRRCCVMCSAGTQAARDASLWQQSQLAREVHY